METGPRLEDPSETTRLLSELDVAIDQLSVMREIVTRYEHLHKLESITGPSRRTRVMRKEIELLESKFKCERGDRLADLDLIATQG